MSNRRTATAEPATAPGPRAGNLRLVVRAVLASPEPISRAGVAAVTGLTRSTVSRLVDELVAGGLLDELQRTPPAGRGRPGIPLVLSSRVAALGLQVNPGFTAGRVVDLRGRTVADQHLPADLVASDPRDALRSLGALARRVRRELPRDMRLVGCGLALPGIVSADDGVVLSAPNLGWSGVRVAPLLGRGALGGLGLSIGNEADLAARTVAEAVPGGSARLSDFIYVSGEVGIGGAAVVGGRVFPGRHGWAGEIGHVAVDPEGPACRCGATGCLEQYAGRRAMLQAARLPADGPVSLLVEHAGSGHPEAARAVSAAARALGIALASTVNVLDIPTIVLGGHLAELADVLRPRLTQELNARVMSARWQPVTVEVAGDDAAPGATGAAYLLLDAVLDSPATWVDRTGVRG